MARACKAGTSSLPAGTFVDGVISGASNGGKLGYRLYPHARREEVPVIVYFHGNAELAAEYDRTYSYYHAVGASLLVRFVPADYHALFMLVRVVVGFCTGCGLSGVRLVHRSPCDHDTAVGRRGCCCRRVICTICWCVPVVLHQCGLQQLWLWGCAVFMQRAFRRVPSSSCSGAPLEACAPSTLHPSFRINLVYVRPLSTLVCLLARVKPASECVAVFSTSQALIVESGIAKLLELPMVGMLAASMPMLAVCATMSCLWAHTHTCDQLSCVCVFPAVGRCAAGSVGQLRQDQRCHIASADHSWCS